ncbi:hypothetical protein DRJ22_03275 [Candidatus Woesearchaeota archaeon]|nr:MAG: hypothetical protein B6U93_01770 [Candidatus Woesearchaeota archaeon ex4484_78]RLE45925.1 MAG: hypothetical protein DRJ22_03275 [Candidatus Woesearchaeota archaeon]
MSEKIILPKISKKKFISKSKELYTLPGFLEALNFVEDNLGLQYCEEHLFPVINIVKEVFTARQITVDIRNQENPINYFLTNIYLAAALHDAKEFEIFSQASKFSFCEDTIFYHSYLKPAMKKPLRLFEKPIDQSLEHITRLEESEEAAPETKIIIIADRICDLPYKFFKEKEKQEHLEASIPYLFVASELTATELYKKLKDIMIKGFKLLE